MKNREITCEWCAAKQVVLVENIKPMRTYKCEKCGQSLARMIARNVLING